MDTLGRIEGETLTELWEWVESLSLSPTAIRSRYAPNRSVKCFGMASNLQSIPKGRARVFQTDDPGERVRSLGNRLLPGWHSLLVCGGDTTIGWHRDHGHFEGRAVMVNLGEAYYYLNTWVAPFFMGPVNTRVVRRSSALSEQWQEPYGPDFTYQEYLKFDEPLAWLKATGITAGLALFMGIFQQPQLRRWLQPILPQPGSGPSEQTMNEGWFSCELVGTVTDGRKVRGLIRDQGDPGNRATVKFVCESALSLALQLDELPGGKARGGILTPATGLGDVLAERLRQAGMMITVVALPT